MAETHVMATLKERRIKLTTDVERIREELRRRAIDLDHVEAALKHCEAIMKARGLDTDDTVANLKHWSVRRGLIRSMPGPGQEDVWKIVR
jgi:hypothetical protein